MNQSVVLITGASRGIGKAAALRFATAGCHVIINGAHDPDALLETKTELEALGTRCSAILADVSTPDGASQLYSETIRQYGRIDILINNAGISYIGLLTDMTPEQWDMIISTNLSSVFYCCQKVIPQMVTRKSGRIINISSIWGVSGASCEVAYSASKGGVNSFTKALAKELAPSNIQVNAIAFGVIDTSMNKGFTKDELEALKEEIPAGRFATAPEAADFIFQLAMNAGDYCTGQVITFDGGFL